MSSPFPGMDPHVEESSIWPDCHAGLIGAMSADLNAHLPERYSAWKDRNVWVYEPDAETRSRLKEPDIFVTEHPREAHGAGGVAVLSAPATSVLPVIRREGNRFSVRDPLPPIPIPLNPEDAPGMLDLGACFRRAYDEAPYRKEIDY